MKKGILLTILLAFLAIPLVSIAQVRDYNDPVQRPTGVNEDSVQGTIGVNDDVTSVNDDNRPKNAEDRKRILKQKADDRKAKREAEKEKREEKKEKIIIKNLEDAKKRATRVIDSAIKKLNSIKNRIDKMKGIDEADKTAIGTKIEARITVLEAKKIAVQAATTKDEIKTALDGSIKELRDTKDLVKEMVAAIHKGHLNKMITKLEALVTRIEAKVSGFDTATKEAALSKIDEAKDIIAEAKAFLASGDLINAKNSLKEANKVLKEAITNNDAETEGGENE